jgi:hypothetical protein
MSKIQDLEMARLSKHVHSYVVKSARRMLMAEYRRLRRPYLRTIPKAVKGSDRQRLLDQRSGVARDDFGLDGSPEGITIQEVLAALSIVSSGEEECNRCVCEWQAEGFSSYVPTKRSQKSLPATRAPTDDIVLEELRKRKSLVDVSGFLF